MVILRLLAIIGWALAMSVAGASLIRLEKGGVLEPADWAILTVAFAALGGALAMPALVYATKTLLRLAWSLIKLAAQVALHEIVKWLLLAGAASLGLLHYLERLPAF